MQQDGQYTQVSHRISRITEVASSPSVTPQQEVQSTFDEPPKSRERDSSAEGETSRRLSVKPESVSEGVTSPSASEAPSSARDFDHVLEYYSFVDVPEPTDHHFRPPFSPITEESSSQLSPPTPFRPESRGSKRGPLPPGRFFTGSTAGGGGESTI